MMVTSFDPKSNQVTLLPRDGAALRFRPVEAAHRGHAGMEDASNPARNVPLVGLSAARSKNGAPRICPGVDHSGFS
jgi:hypothetical protein